MIFGAYGSKCILAMLKVFMLFIIIFACGEGSDELNPLLKGRWGRSKKNPCHPWQDGAYNNPRGAVCRVCSFTFMLAGFAERSGSLDNLLTEMKASDIVLLF